MHFLVKAATVSASSTPRPLIRSSTSRAFCGETRWNLASARNSFVFSATAIGLFLNLLENPVPSRSPFVSCPLVPCRYRALAPASAALLLPPVCPLKVRVGANSPSLCPTMFSVTYTGTNFLPLCTAIVCPTNSGKIVERRDQVFTTFLSLAWFNTSIFTVRCASTNGPFFVERAINLPLLLAAADDERVRPLVVACLVAARRLAPRGHRMTAARGLALAAAVRVIHRVHGHAAIAGPYALPAVAPGFTDRHILMVRVAHRDDGRQAFRQHLARL